MQLGELHSLVAVKGLVVAGSVASVSVAVGIVDLVEEVCELPERGDGFGAGAEVGDHHAVGNLVVEAGFEVSGVDCR